MQLTPRYGQPELVRFEWPGLDPTAAVLRQRQRLASELETFDDSQWAASSRCEGWSNQDVIAHLVGTNQFWTYSVASGRAGSPTTLLSTFDPVATPAEMVEAVRGAPPEDTLRLFIETNDAFANALDGLATTELSVIAEAPPGHVPISVVLLHALWDSWIHERDVLFPVGLTPTEEPDEVELCLRYAAAVGPALLATTGSTRAGSFAVEASDPDIAFVVEVGATVVVRPGSRPTGTSRIVGAAPALIDSLTFREALVVDFADDDRWMLDGLADVFDRSDQTTN